MTNTLKQPPYILAHPGDMSGCGFHRMLRPMEIMARCGVAAGRPEYAFLPDDVLRTLHPDIIVWQRQSGEDHLREMMRYREVLPDCHFVYEIDDALGAVPEKSWHKAYMIPGIDDRTAEAALLCDSISVTTDGLERHMRAICSAADPSQELDIRIIPNMLGRDDLNNVDSVLKQIPKPESTKLRIGWGGGIGHKGDLEILHDAMIALKDDVIWVFLGMDPDVPEGVEKQFMGAVPPQHYLMGLASLRVDLVVAPIEDIPFNHSKSNLRLIEAGACMFPVLASPVEPYLTDKPPVVQHVQNDEWEAAIRAFMKKGRTERGWHGERMRRWVEQNYVMDERAAERLEGWLPKGVKPFQPKQTTQAKKKGGKHDLLIVHPGNLDLKTHGRMFKTLAEALAVGGDKDILYVRKNARISAEQITRMAEPCGVDIATVSALTNDGGPLGFPAMGQFLPIDDAIGESLDRICQELVDGHTAGMEPTIPACAGPVVIVRRQALDAVGEPILQEGDSDDLALIEWSGMASARGFRSVAHLGSFIHSEEPAVYPQAIAEMTANRIKMRWPQGRFDQREIDIFRERLELVLHKETYRFVQPPNTGDYPLWAEVRDSFGPRTRKAMLEWVQEKERPVVEVIRYAKQGDPTLLDTHADWVVFVTDEARVPPQLVPGFLDAIVRNPGASIIYADHDYLTPEGGRQGHDFKPNFDHHMLLGRDYVTTVFAVRADVLKDYVEDETKVPTGFAQAELYQLVLRTIEERGRSCMGHLDRIMASIPVPDLANLNEVSSARCKVAEQHAKRMGWSLKVEPHCMGMGLMAVTYQPTSEPLVSIIVPSKNNLDMLLPCLSTLLSMTAYKNFEVLVVDNGSDQQKVIDYLDGIADERVRVLRKEQPFNWSKINNWAVTQAKGDLLVFLNDDTRVLAPTWLTQMVGASQVPGVGTVGGKLLYPNQAIQHVGVFVDNGVCSHFHKGVPSHIVGYHGIAAISHEATAVTGACMLVSRDVFEKTGRFPEDMANNFNDVVFCWDVMKLGFVNVVAMQAELQHIEGASRITARTEEGKEILLADGVLLRQRCPDKDPYWNRNLVAGYLHGGLYVTGSNLDVLYWLPRPWPWSDKLESRRILYIGHQGHIAQERKDGDAIFQMEVRGHEARISNPPMNNVRTFDIRDPTTPESVLRPLDLNEVIITSLLDADPLLLSFLTRLNVPVTYRPVDSESLCPRLDLKLPGGTPCDGGWRKPGQCQACVDAHGSPHGYVGHMGWTAEWLRFMQSENVAIDLSMMGQDHMQAFLEVNDVGNDSAAEDIRAA